ncbi:MAG: hypothetical protein V3U29_00925 [Phycisphaeraceae bacterium]
MPTPIAIATHAAAERCHRRRDEIEHLLSLAQYLDEPDRLLIHQAYRHGVPMADLARLAGKSPRAVQARLIRLFKLIRQPLFGFVVLHGDLLPPPTRRVAHLVVLHGHSLRRTADMTGQSLHRVRQHMRTVCVLARL